MISMYATALLSAMYKYAIAGRECRKELKTQTRAHEDFMEIIGGKEKVSTSDKLLFSMEIVGYTLLACAVIYYVVGWIF